MVDRSSSLTDHRILLAGLGENPCNCLQWRPQSQGRNLMAKRASAGLQSRTQNRPQRAKDALSHSQPAGKLLFAQYAATKVLAESATLAEAASGILQAICETLGWEFGALWSIDRNAGALTCTETWHVPSAA